MSPGSTAETHSLCLHLHRRPHGGPHHSVSHLDHHLLYGGDQAELLRGVLVHPPPLHRLLHRPRLSWIRVQDFPQRSFVLQKELLFFLKPVLLVGYVQAHCEESSGRASAQHHFM